MRGYGLPRDNDVEYPDIADIQLYGLKSCTGNDPNGRDFKSTTRKAKNRQSSRRIWKKKERLLAKKDIREEV